MFVRSIIFHFLAFLFCICSPLLVLAQEVEQSIDISIQSSPTDPSAGQTVSLEAISFGLDLNQASLTWTYGGKIVANGFGKTRVDVIAPTAGSVAIVTVSVTASGISPLSASIVLRPGSVDLLWEGADALTPPFYKGRALVPPGGIFRVVAIPAPSAPRQTSFSWQRNDGAVLEASGIGKSQAIFQNTAFERQEKIKVVVSGGMFEGNGSTTILPRTPIIVAYQKRDGFVNYSSGSIDTIASRGRGVVALFEPFFFSSTNGALQNLIFDVRDGEDILYGDYSPNEIRLSKSENNANSVLSVSISPVGYSLQNIKKIFSVVFE